MNCEISPWTGLRIPVHLPVADQSVIVDFAINVFGPTCLKLELQLPNCP